MPEPLGLRIRLERVRQHMQQKTLAHQIGITPTAMWQIECGRSDPTSSHLRALAQALHVTSDYLLGLREER